MLKSILILIVLTLAAPGAAVAQGAGQQQAAEDDRLNAEVIRLYREGKYNEALPLAKRLLELREQAPGGGGLKLAYALTNLGNLYARKGLNKEAEPVFTRALAVAEKSGAAETDFAADLDAQLGLLNFEAGKYREAEGFFQRALDLREKLHGAEDARLVPALLNLADVNFLRTQPEQAHALLGRALSILKRRPYSKDEATARRLKNYYCPLMSIGPFKNVELTKQLGSVVWGLEEPEKAAKYEQKQKEREERGESDKEVVAGGVLNGHAISKPQPSYPAAAKQARVSGTVVIQILVDESGKVVKAEPYCGHPLLAKAAVESALAARFTPTLLSGLPVKVSGIITYNFVLQ